MAFDIKMEHEKHRTSLINLGANPYLTKSPSSMELDEKFMYINEEILLIKKDLDKLLNDSNDLEYAERIQQINTDLELMIFHNSDKQEYSATLDKNRELLETRKEKVVNELSSKKDEIENKPPEEVLQVMLKDIEAKISLINSKKETVLKHLSEQAELLGDPEFTAKIVEEIQGLQGKYENVTGELQKEMETLTSADPERIAEIGLEMFNKSLAAVQWQHEQALNNLGLRKAIIEDQTFEEKVTSEVDAPMHPKRLSDQIQEVDKRIESIEEMTEEARAALEQQKRELRKRSDPNAIYDFYHEMDRFVRAEKMKRHIPINDLDEHLEYIDREISYIQAVHDKAVTDLENKKKYMMLRLCSIERLDKLIITLTNKIFEMQREYRDGMNKLQNERETIMARVDLDDNQLALIVAELDRRINDYQNTHDDVMFSLYGQRDELQRESVMKMQDVDHNKDELKRWHQEIMLYLEHQKTGVSPQQHEEINWRIAEINEIFEADMAEIEKLQEKDSNDLNRHQKLLTDLEEKGLRMTVSGHVLIRSGRLLTLEKAKCLGLLDKNVEPWDSVLLGRREEIAIKEPSGSRSTFSEDSTASSESRLSSEDVHYLKEALGKPLTAALTEITAKQPRDPIHYLAHWLFKYRYNQELDYMQKREIQELIDERERLAKERWHKFIQEEAEAAVLEMVMRAEQEAMRRELDRIARETAMLEAEYEELQNEARDTMGTYDGPPVGKKMSASRA